MISLSFPLSLIGIYDAPGSKPAARIKRGAEVEYGDFTVLEFYSNGVPLIPEVTNRLGQPQGVPTQHVWGKLSKKNLATKGAIQRLSRAADIPESEIGTAGLKDSAAITAQLFSVPARYLDNILDADLSRERFWLQDLYFCDEPIHQGAHSGNYFRITVWPRDGSRFSRAELEFVATQLNRVAQSGFPNFFFTQRFGVRPSAHLVGAAMVSGDYIKAAEQLLFMSSNYEEEWAQQARNAAWAATTLAEKDRALASVNAPYFAQELKVLRRLERGLSLEDSLLNETSPSFLVAAYFSFLWNQAVSTHLRMGWDLPEKFPFLKGIPSQYQYDEARESYGKVGILLPAYPEHCHQEAAHIVWRPTTCKPEGVKARLASDRCDLEFRLGVNAFATALLNESFNIGGDD